MTDRVNAPVPRVLLVTGAYEPEISAAGVVCRAVTASLGSRASISVLATAVDPALPARGEIDGVPVFRAHVGAASRRSTAPATVGLVRQFAAVLRRFDIVHLHGVSRKNIPIVALAKLFGKRVVIHLHTAGQDEPGAIRRSGRTAWWAFRQAELVLSVSPVLSDRYIAAGLDPTKLRSTPNGVDLERFAPGDDVARAHARRELGLPGRVPIVLFVGFFSRDKRPDALFRAWRRVAATERDSVLVFVGAAVPTYYEIDGSLASAIRADAEAAGLGARVIFAPPTTAIERYFAAADVFALPSVREAMPLALLEAMASGLACVASALPGATDVLVDTGADGRLIAHDDEAAWAAALGELVADRTRRYALGRRARETAVARFGIGRCADTWLDAYREVLMRMPIRRAGAMVTPGSVAR